eukprot:gene4937-6154_t
MILTITLQIDPINTLAGSITAAGGTSGLPGGTLTRSQARASINVTSLQTQSTSKTYKLDQNSSYKTVFLAICLLFGINEDQSQDYILQVESNKKYLNWPRSTDESKNKQVVKYLIESGESGLLLKFNPSFRSSRWVKALNEGDEHHNEKDIIFHLKFKLQEPEFAESFIEQNGMEGILRMVTSAKGNAQTYALASLRACLEYISGMDVISKTPHLIKQLFSLVESSVTGVCRGSLELLFVMCSFRKDDGFVSIHQAAKSTAQAQGKTPYSNIVKLLDSGDLETKINAFTLLNVLLNTCPKNEKVDKLVKKWGELGLHDKLRSLTDIQHKEFQIQLEIYEDISGINLRTKASRLEEICKRLKAKIIEYECQQPLITILKEELKLSQQLIREASTDRIFLNSHPMQRYLGPLNTSYPADLSFLKTTVIEREKISDFEKRVAALTEQLRQETKLSDELKNQVLANKKIFDQSITEIKLENEKFLQEETKLKVEIDSLREKLKSYSSIQSSPSTSSDSLVLQQQLHESNLEINRLRLIIEEKIPPNEAQINNVSPTGSLLNQSEKVFLTTPPTTPPADPTSPDTTSSPNGADSPELTPTASAPPPPPPPPGGAPPPPPPPPPGPGAKKPASTTVQPTKPVVNPGSKMKPLYWKRIILQPTNRTESIWDQVLEPTFDAKDFEDAFCQKKKASPIKISDDGADQPTEGTTQQTKLVSLIDIKKSNSIAFMLAKIPPVDQLKKCINELNTTLLNKETIKTLISNVPVEEDYQLIKNSELPESRLDKPERWILQMYGFPAMKERLRCWLFQLEYQEAYQNIISSLEKLSTAIQDTKSNENFKKILGIILVLGNHMNGGSSRGQADGFNLEILDALVMTKDIDNKATLLDYIVKISLDKYPKTKHLSDEFESLKNVQLSIQDIQTDINDLENNFNVSKNLVNKAIEQLSDHQAKETFNKNIAKFLNEHVEEELKSLSAKQKESFNNFYQLLEYFGYSKNNTSVTCQQFFGSIYTFASLFTKQCIKLEKEREAANNNKLNQGPEGKKIAGGADPLAALANAIKLGQQNGLRKRPVV